MSHFQSVATDQERQDRLREFAARDRDAEAAAEDSKRQNKDFTQVYVKGWRRLQALMQTSPAAARVYAYLAEHIDGHAGAVVVSQEVMANDLGISERTIRRQIRFLEDGNALVVIKVGTGVNAYALAPDEIWKSWDDKKDTAAFYTKTLVRTADKANGEVRRKLKIMMTERG